MSTLLYNGRFLFQRSHDSEEVSFVDTMIIENGTISFVGRRDDSGFASSFRPIEKIDMKQRTICPGFIDGHMHLLMTGQSLKKLTVEWCVNSNEIRSAIKGYAAEHKDASRILCRGWQQKSTNGEATVQMLDGLDDLGRPIYVEALDLHSTWCNSEALRELGLHAEPDGSGLVSEGDNVNIVWPFLARNTSAEDRVDALRTAIRTYTASGYTGVVEMAMDEIQFSALRQLRETDGELPIHIAMHWLVSPGGTEAEALAQVDRAVALQSEYNLRSSPSFRIAGIKLICDGVVDACTAALTEPYSHNGQLAPTMWTLSELAPIVRRADEVGLQIALHAIGDAAIKLAIDALEQNATPGRRHRIEHLELASPEDAARLGRLGITASIQPVHSDPEMDTAWPKLIGSHRCDRMFPFKEFEDGGASLAIGTDAPTANHEPLPNLYTATTRRSARRPELEERTNPAGALSLCSAIAAATAGAAYSCFAEGSTGTLQVGSRADFVVLDMDWDAKALLQAKITETWFGGKRVYRAEIDTTEKPVPW